MQDAYAEAWRQWSAIRDLPEPASWVRTAAIGYSRAWARRAGQRAGAVPEGPWPPTTPGSRALFGALGTLGEDGRRCLVLYHVVGLPADVIANIEQVGVAQVQAILARSHDHLLGGMNEARERSRADAGGGGSAAERLVAKYSWDQDKTAALQALVVELAGSVATPAMSAIVRRAGSQHRATTAAAIAVLAVGALGGVTIAVSAIGEPPPTGSVVGLVAPPPGPVIASDQPAVSPSATRTRSPIARPRPTRVRVAATPTASTTETSDRSPSSSAEPEPSSEASSPTDPR